jgi:hypothetical protein
VIVTRTLHYFACDAWGCPAEQPAGIAPDQRWGYEALNAGMAAFRLGWRQDPETGRLYCPEHREPSSRRVFELVGPPPDRYGPEFDD